MLGAPAILLGAPSNTLYISMAKVLGLLPIKSLFCRLGLKSVNYIIIKVLYVKIE